MSIPVPIGELHSATASGRRPVVVRCERCSNVYGYLLARQVSGHGFSPVFLGEKQAQDDAAKAARNSLAYTMANDCDAIPCPSCGHLQAVMIERVRRRVVRTATTLAAFPILIAGILASSFRDSQIYFVISFCGLLAFGFGLKGLVRHWNPNNFRFRHLLIDKTALLPAADVSALLQAEQGGQEQGGKQDGKGS